MIYVALQLLARARVHGGHGHGVELLPALTGRCPLHLLSSATAPRMSTWLRMKAAPSEPHGVTAPYVFNRHPAPWLCTATVIATESSRQGYGDSLEHQECCNYVIWK
jgi:hypothetical protein